MNNETWLYRKNRLKYHGFKIIGSSDNLTSPHGNQYCQSYILSLNDLEFDMLIEKEKV